MVKRFLYLFLIIFTVGMFNLSCQKKEAYKKELKTQSYKIVVISEKPPFVGINRWKIFIYDQNENPVTDVKVGINGYMPPMPGMPEMSFDYPVEKSGNHYESDVNLNMGGTWQITISVEKNGKKEEAKFGFNL